MKQQDKTKVLFFLPPTAGGAERMTIIIAKMLPLDEFDVKFVIVGKSKGDIASFIPTNYPIELLKIKKIWYGGTVRIWNIVRKEKPAVVFSSMLYLNARLIIAAKPCGARVVIRNNIDLSRTECKINVVLVRLTYRWADKIIAQQEEMRHEILAYTGLRAEKVVSLQNPIDVECIEECLKAASPFPNGSENQYKYVWAARFSPQKAQDIIVEAFEMVHRKRPNTHLYLVGKYDENDSFFKDINSFVEKHHIQDYVHVVGFDSNPYRWMKHADCYVMPSRFEGLPNSLIEAMYIGKPVVATRCIPVVDRMIENGFNGIIVEPENAEALAEGMMNVTSLHDFQMTYKPSSQDEFICLFRLSE